MGWLRTFSVFVVITRKRTLLARNSALFFGVYHTPTYLIWRANFQATETNHFRNTGRVAAVQQMLIWVIAWA